MLKAIKCFIGLILFLVMTSANAKKLVLFTPDGPECRTLFFTDSAAIANLSQSGRIAYFSGTTSAVIDSVRIFDATMELNAEKLYNSAQAFPMLLNEGKTSVTLDLRNRTVDSMGIVITDALDPLDPDNSGISAASIISNVVIYSQSQLSAGANISMMYKTGSSFFEESGWSDWVNAANPNCELKGLSGRYLKLRYLFSTNNMASLPALNRVVICVNYEDEPSFHKTIILSTFENHNWAPGAYPFGWESRETERIKAMITGWRLDTVGQTKSTEFERVIAIMDWVARRPNVRDANYAAWSPYPWNLDSVFLPDGSIRGHCMSYAEVLISVLTGLGYQARHWAIEGLDNDNDHEVVEYWSNQKQKWIYLDASLDTYYKSTATQEPLSIKEMHDIYITEIWEPHESNAIQAMAGGYIYGVPGTWNWRYGHGYSTCGYMKLTERNNFHSQPLPEYRRFGWGYFFDLDLNVFHNWTDAATPPYDGRITNHVGRVRDFWYAMNQASLKVKRTSEYVISLEFGNTQPFFDHYSIQANTISTTSSLSTYEWHVQPGQNSLGIVPVNQWVENGIGGNIIIIIECPGDLDDNLIVNIDDLSLVTGHFGQSSVDGEWDLLADANRDNRISIDDLTVVTLNYGKNY